MCGVHLSIDHAAKRHKCDHIGHTQHCKAEMMAEEVMVQEAFLMRLAVLKLS